MAATKRNELRECFDMLDLNRTGRLELQEVFTALSALGVRHPPDTHTLQRIMMSREAARSRVTSHHHNRHHHHHHRHHRAATVTASHHHTIAKHRAASVSYGDFVSIMTDPSILRHADADAEPGPDGNVGLPLRLMLSAFRRKATLDEFMSNSSARARLAAKMGPHGDADEKMSGMKGATLNHNHGSASGRDHSRVQTSYSQLRHKQRQRVAALRQGVAHGREERVARGEERGVESMPPTLGTDKGGRRGLTSETKAGSSLFASSLSLSGFGNTVMPMCTRSATSLPSVNTSKDLNLTSEYVCDTKTARRDRAKRLKSRQHEHVAHMQGAWRQQLLLLREYGGSGGGDRGEGDSSTYGAHKAAARASDRAATATAATTRPVPPKNLDELQARDARPSTSMLIQDASRKLEEAQAMLFSQSRQGSAREPLRRRAQTTAGKNGEGGAGDDNDNAGLGGREQPRAAASSSASMLPTTGARRQRPWSRYKTWRRPASSVPPPWLASDTTNTRTIARKMRTDGNASSTQNAMEIKLYAMSLVRS